MRQFKLLIIVSLVTYPLANGFIGFQTKVLPHFISKTELVLFGTGRFVNSVKLIRIPQAATQSTMMGIFFI
jgi:hypothetical protein